MPGKTIQLILLGLVAGVLGGIFGIGGGLIMVPGLVLLGMDDTRAVGTSFATILLPVGLFGVLEYYHKGNIDLRAAALLAIGFLVGSVGGAFIANQNVLPKNTFKLLYAAFLILVAGKYIWDVVASGGK